MEDIRNRYPIVFKVAVDYLSIPSTSCESERAFSSARRTITRAHNDLSGSLIEALQLQNNWIRRRVVDRELLNLRRYMETLQSVCVD